MPCDDLIIVVHEGGAQGYSGGFVLIYGAEVSSDGIGAIL